MKSDQSGEGEIGCDSDITFLFYVTVQYGTVETQGDPRLPNLHSRRLEQYIRGMGYPFQGWVDKRHSHSGRHGG